MIIAPANSWLLPHSNLKKKKKQYTSLAYVYYILGLVWINSSLICVYLRILDEWKSSILKTDHNKL